METGLKIMPELHTAGLKENIHVHQRKKLFSV
jgi:hypothetical protein